MLAVILSALTASFLLFLGLWNLQPAFWNLVSHIPSVALDEDTFIKTLQKAALKLNLPEVGLPEAKALEKLEDFFALVDDYTALNIYDSEEGTYICGKKPEVMSRLIIGSIMDSGYRMTRGKGEVFMQEQIPFKNRSATLTIISYHPARIIYPYFFFCLGSSILLFLSGVLWFIKAKMDAVLQINGDVLRMASGDLSTPVTDCGSDEIGMLSREIDGLRQSLDEHMRQEAASRKANQDLITAMSHDLRTPLTILNGYLEVLHLKKTPPAMQEEFLNRCLRKTADIKEMTDKMFEYALVFEETENVSLLPLPAAYLEQCLTENSDFIRLAGFTVELSLTGFTGTINGDRTILKRIFSNLFSNILKYGDKSSSVLVTSETERQCFKITLVNSVRQDTTGIESNQIGLKSVEKMTALHQGTLYVMEADHTYSVTLSFPVLTTQQISRQTRRE